MAHAPRASGPTHYTGRPLYLLAFLGAGLLITLALVGIDRWFVRPRPAELVPAAPPGDSQPDPSPWMKVSYLEKVLAYTAPDLALVRPDPRSGVCFIFDGPADTTAVDGRLPASEAYADCWRGVVRCEADQPALPEGPHAARAGDFYLFGDVRLPERVKPAAESIHFGPYRGTGEPVPPLP